MKCEFLNAIVLYNTILAIPLNNLMFLARVARDQEDVMEVNLAIPEHFGFPKASMTFPPGTGDVSDPGEGIRPVRIVRRCTKIH